MSRFDHSHDQGEPQGRDLLREALLDVAVPAGLDGRLLAAVKGQEGDTVNSPVCLSSQKRGWTRRRVLAAGVSASVAAAMAGGAYSWHRRELGLQEVVSVVQHSLADPNWVAWSSLSADGMPEHGLPFPAVLRRSDLWQARDLRVASSSVAYNMTLPGGPGAVLFASRMFRGLQAFPTLPPGAPQSVCSGRWSHVAAWQAPAERGLYVVAIQSNDALVKRDYPRLFRAGPALPFV